MKLKFKIQQYQTDAVDAVIRVFGGQPNRGLNSYKIDNGGVYIEQGGRRVEAPQIDFGAEGYKNTGVELSEADILKNIHSVQADNNINLSGDVVKRLGCCQLDVEMETGTGKTYVYIKTMFELNQRYGWTKFIVVVPSIAIREGVKKSFDVTTDHFMEIYGKKARYFIYNSDNLNQIDAFSQSADISVMIINTQAFNTSMKEGAKNKAARIIYDKRDEFGSRRPIDVIAANNPIVILDEPQKMGGVATQTALARFNPLFTINYSATHKETHNPVYVLDALDAYNQKLVKKIEVVGFDLKNLKGTDSYIYFADIVLSSNKSPQARLEIEIQSKSGSIRREIRNFAEGDDLYGVSGNMEQYRGFIVTDINVDLLNCANSKVTFGNGQSLYIKEVTGDVSADHKARIQIRETIAAHFRKESALFSRGIKCLSLFFIDEVANYRQYDDEGQQKLGRYGEIFEQEYVNAFNENQNLFEPEYMAYLGNISASATHAGYFSIDKKGRSVNSDTKRGSDQSDDISAYDLILKNKERLLSLDEPVRFIFSHSALREGWDNPNVFQICSLRQSGSVAKRRQEVGRGLRLCVDRNGVRQDSEALSEEVHNINRLTVIASEGYATFVEALQKDIKADLYNRPTKADPDFFAGKSLTTENGDAHIVVDKKMAQKIFVRLCMKNYITEEGDVTDAFRSDLANDALKSLGEDFVAWEKSIFRLVQSVYDPKVLNGLIENAGKPLTPENKLNDNFLKPEFQELWNRINHKYAYIVSFDSEELIEKAVKEINSKLYVPRLSYVVTRGTQRDDLTQSEMAQNNMIAATLSETTVLKTDVVSNVKYDLLGKISAATKLTRKTVASILTEISGDKFNMYRENPEAFIRKVSQLINEQKATIIVDHISYNRLDGCYDSEIFTLEKRTTLDKAYLAKHSIMDYVFTDGYAKQSVERKFVESLDNAKEVAVFAKLPKDFYIPTPMGKYSPDWAIAFKEGMVEHVYFVAETKGSMSSLELRAIEQNKIICAGRLFEQFPCLNVKFDLVNSFETLMDKVK